jgi:hypothetical protein
MGTEMNNTRSFSMAKQFRKAGVLGTALLSAGLLLISLVGGALAAVPEHADIILKDAAGALITDLSGENNAYSVKTTCFTGSCHGSGSGVMAYGYNDIERHSYHAQLAANDQYGWAAWNPDGDAWESGPAPKGKNWVQGQGHVGAW